MDIRRVALLVAVGAAVIAASFFLSLKSSSCWINEGGAHPRGRDGRLREELA